MTLSQKWFYLPNTLAYIAWFCNKGRFLLDLNMYNYTVEHTMGIHVKDSQNHVSFFLILCSARAVKEQCLLTKNSNVITLPKLCV